LSWKKLTSTDSTFWAPRHEAKDIELLEKSVKIVEPIMGVPFWREGCAVQARNRHG